MSLISFLYRLFPREPLHINEFYREMAGLLPEQGKILDLGCGDNTSLAAYRKPGREIWGTDFQIHPDLRYPESFRLLGPGGEIPFADDSFDCVTALWVLEHVQAPAAFLEEIYRVLKPGGWLIAHSINGLHYVTWARRLFDMLPHSATQQLVHWLYGRAGHDTFPTRYRLNSDSQLRRFAHKAGLKVVRIQRFIDFGNYFRFSPLLQRLAAIVDWLLEKLAPGLGRLYFTVSIHKPAAPTMADLQKKSAA